MPKVVKSQVFDTQMLASASKGGANRFGMIGKASTTTAGQQFLFEKELPGIDASQIEKWHLLVISFLLAWVLPVPDRDHAFGQIDVRPFDLADLLLSHGRRDCETDNPTHWDDHVGLGVEVVEQHVDFVFGRAPAAFVRPAHETKAGEGGAGQTNALGVHMNAEHGGGVGQNRAEV